MLDNVMLYWLTGSGASSARLYWESFGAFGGGETVTVPSASRLPERDHQTTTVVVRELVQRHALDRHAQRDISQPLSSQKCISTTCERVSARCAHRSDDLVGASAPVAVAEETLVQLAGRKSRQLSLIINRAWNLLA